MKTVLTLRVSRRAIGAVVLAGDDLAFTDGRHLSSRRERTVTAALRYFRRLCDQHRPRTLVVDAPPSTESSSVSAELMEKIKSVASERAIPMLLLGRADVQAAYGVPSLHNRGEVRSIVNTFWPRLETLQGQVKPYVVDAAAAALYAECQLVLNPLPA